MTGPDHSGKQGAISFRIAMALYAVLAVFAILTLKKGWLFVALVVVGGAAVKTYISHVRSKIE